MFYYGELTICNTTATNFAGRMLAFRVELTDSQFAFNSHIVLWKTHKALIRAECHVRRKKNGTPTLPNVPVTETFTELQ